MFVETDDGKKVRRTLGYNVRPGTEIVCPGCDEVMMICVQTPTPMERDYSHCFEYKAFSGERVKTLCPMCGTNFMSIDLGLYTRQFGYTW